MKYFLKEMPLIKNTTILLGLFTFCLDIYGNERSSTLTLYVYPPRQNINWTSPNSFAATLVRNIALAGSSTQNRYKSSLGHAIVHLSCTDNLGKSHNVWTGLTGQNDLSIDRENVFEKGQGLSVVFKTYRDGEIQGEYKQRNRVANYVGKKGSKPLYIKTNISPKQCGFLIKMEEEFRRRSWDTITPVREWYKKPDEEILHYGFEIHDPLQSYLSFLENRTNKLGGGCTSYANAFLKAVGLWHPLFESRWTRTVTISEKLMGTDSHPVAFSDILKSFKWVYEGWQNVTKNIYEPEFMWDFMKSSMICAKNSQHPKCDPDLFNWVQQNFSEGNFFDSHTLMADRKKFRWVWSKSLNKQVKEWVHVQVPVTIHGIHLQRDLVMNPDNPMDFLN